MKEGEDGSNASSNVSVDLPVPRHMVGYVIGRGGETIREIQAKSGAFVQVRWIVVIVV